MSKVLMIRHLPTELSFQDKEKLLKHFGAQRVWETSSKRYFIFADFASIEKAKISLARLHQLEIANRRLVVEYCFQKGPVKDTKSDLEQTSATTKLVKEFLRALNAWNPSVDFYQPPPPNLKYKYPDPGPVVIVNLIYALFSHKQLYVQILHLMNKMSLDVPFGENPNALQFFKETFRHFFHDDIPPPLPESEAESELSSNEDELKKENITTMVKRKPKIPKPTRKRRAVVIPSPILPKVKKVPINQEEVFETVTPILETKKISVNVPQDALKKPTEEPKVIGELGKFQKEDQPVQVEETHEVPEQPTVSKRELLRNRISYKDMKILPVFKNYHPGQPSMRLYIKNLAKGVLEQDVKRIYKRYVEGLTDDEQIGFDVRVMQEGRMKGQAFVTFPSIQVAETALNETNGYMLKERPMVVQFARAANKNSID